MKVPVVPGVKLIPKSLRQDLTNTSELIKPTQTECTARYDRSVTDVTGLLIILPYNL